MEKEKALIVFEGKHIRRIWFNKEWWFSVADVCGALTESIDSGAYWRKLKQRLKEEGSEVVTFCHGLPLEAADGKKYETDCATVKSLLRIIQSIPSPKAEPFKQWLARVGYERVQEIQDPELAQKRMKELFKAKGYSDDWIEKRVRGIAIRDELTDEWKRREVGTEREYAILTAEISTATFGMTPSEYKQFKCLKKENLRDHMNKDALGFTENKKAAQEGGQVAGNARKDAEQRIGRIIVSPENYVSGQEQRKKLVHKKNK